jgi:membrane protein
MKISDLVLKFLSSLLYYLRGIYRHMHDEEGFLLASGIAFNAILCAIPLLLLFTSLLGTFLHSSELAVQWIDRVVETAFRDQPYAGTIKATLKQVVGDIITNRASYGFIAAGVLLWTGTSLFSSVRGALHRVYHIKSTKNLFLSILEDIVWVFIIGVLFIVLNLISWIYKIIQTLISRIPTMQDVDFGVFEGTFPIVASFALTLFTFFAIYRFIPDQSPTSRVAWRSALTTALLWETAARLFSWYLTQFHSFSAIYGTYAFLLVLLIWVYYSSVVFVIGGVVGKLYHERVSGVI